MVGLSHVIANTLRTVANGCDRKNNAERTRLQPPDLQSSTRTLRYSFWNNWKNGNFEVERNLVNLKFNSSCDFWNLKNICVCGVFVSWEIFKKRPLQKILSAYDFPLFDLTVFGGGVRHGWRTSRGSNSLLSKKKTTWMKWIKPLTHTEFAAFLRDFFPKCLRVKLERFEQTLPKLSGEWWMYVNVVRFCSLQGGTDVNISIVDCGSTVGSTIFQPNFGSRKRRTSWYAYAHKARLRAIQHLNQSN